MSGVANQASQTRALTELSRKQGSCAMQGVTKLLKNNYMLLSTRQQASMNLEALLISRLKHLNHATSDREMFSLNHTQGLSLVSLALEENSKK